MQNLFAMLQISAAEMYEDSKELAYLTTALDDLLTPISVHNWEDVLASWLSVRELCGKLHGVRSQAVLRQIFHDQDLCKALGMMHQCRLIQQGTRGSKMPASLVADFKRRCSGVLQRDKFIYCETITSEEAAIRTVQNVQSAGAALLGSIVLSSLIGLWNYFIFKDAFLESIDGESGSNLI